MKTFRNRLVMSSLVALSFVVGCGDDEEETSPAVVKKDKAPDADAPEALVEDKPQDLSYTYNAVNRRDPFKTYFDELAGEDPAADTSRLTELQKLDVDKLKLIAVVVGTATPMAMVEDPTGRGHTLRIGTLVGKLLGQVKHIRRGEVVIQEEFRDFTGKRIPQLKELKLEGGAPVGP